MHQGSDFKVFSESCASSGIFSNQITEGIKKSFFCKRKKIYVAILFLAVFLVVLGLLKLTNSTKLQKTKKIKRYLKMNEFNKDEDLKMPKTNVEIISRSGRKAIKLNSPPKTHKSNEIRDSIEKRKGRNELLKRLKPSMLLKGIYIQPKSTESAFENQFDEKQHYTKEINNLMQNYSDPKGKERKWSAKKTYKSNGSPFQLPTKEKKNSKRQKTNWDSSKLDKVSKKHPITIYLDFYSMNNSQNLKKKPKPVSFLENEFHNPVSSHSIRTEKILSPQPQGRHSRMIIKLNLYPKKSIFSEQDEGNPQSKYNERADRFF